MKNKSLFIAILSVFLFISIDSYASTVSSKKADKPIDKISKDHVLLVSTPVVKSKIINLQGKEIGVISLWQAKTGVLMRITVQGLSEGMHGMHFHVTGACIPEEGFSSAGGHVMQHDGDPHGYLNAKGPHAGNLPNLIVGADGKADVELFNPMINLYGRGAENEKVYLLDYDGSALIIHKNRDDYITQPIGGSGERVACAAIRKHKIVLNSGF